MGAKRRDQPRTLSAGDERGARRPPARSAAGPGRTAPGRAGTARPDRHPVLVAGAPVRRADGPTPARHVQDPVGLASWGDHHALGSANAGPCTRGTSASPGSGSAGMLAAMPQRHRAGQRVADSGGVALAPGAKQRSLRGQLMRTSRAASSNSVGQLAWPLGSRCAGRSLTSGGPAPEPAQARTSNPAQGGAGGGSKPSFSAGTASRQARTIR